MASSLRDHVLTTIRRIIPINTVVRWARRSKVPELSLLGTVQSIKWVDTLRNGGGFVFMIMYKDKIYPHHECLSRMFDDYRKYIEYRIGRIDDRPPPIEIQKYYGYTPLRRKKRATGRRRKGHRRLKVPAAANINSSRDLSFHIDDDTWETLGVLIPNSVRMLTSPDTEAWLALMARPPPVLDVPHTISIQPLYSPHVLGNFLVSPGGPTRVSAHHLPVLQVEDVGDPSTWLDPDLDYLLEDVGDIDFDVFDRYLTSTVPV